VSATRTGDGFAVEQRMPLARYFLCVGGVLLALLFIVDAYLPKFPVAAKATANSPVIRILSDRKWPERIVYDTSLPTIIPAQVAGTELVVHAPAMIAGASLGARERAAFAQLPSSDARELRLPKPKMREPKLQRSREKRYAVVPTVLIARQPHFGWFGNRIW
jgi:hypothetical protein